MPEHISYSQISMYMRCGMQYYYRYIEGKILPPGIAMIVGKTGHAGAEKNYVQKIDTHKDLSKQDIIDYTVSVYEEAIVNTEIALTGDDSIDKSKDSLVSSMGVFADDVAPNVQPIAVEHKHILEIPNCKPVIAILDCIDDKKNVRDLKFTGRSKTQSDVDNSLQLSIYAMAYHDMYNSMPESLCFDNLVHTKLPKYVELKTTRTEDDFISVIRIINAVQDAINKEVFLPAPEGSWVCSEKFCGYYQTCKFKNKKIF